MDHRDLAAMTNKWYKSFNRKTMTAVVKVCWEDNDGVYEEEFNVPIIFEVCPTCDGRGTHVNPSIDAHGLTADDFYEDPDFAEEYFRGHYDVSCYECGGRNVVPEIDEEHCDKEVLKKVRDHQHDLAMWAREEAYQRRMGFQMSDKYQEARKEKKRKFQEGYADGARHRRDDEEEFNFGNKDGISKIYKAGWKRGFSDADKAVKELKKQLGEG